MAAQTIPAPQEAVIRSIATSIPTPAGVHLKRIAFDFDHAGEPAIRVVYQVAKKQGHGDARILKLVHFQRAVRDAILAEVVDSFPYVTFEDDESR